MRLAWDADPAADISRLHAFHLVLLAGVAALGHRHRALGPRDEACVERQLFNPVADFLIVVMTVRVLEIEDIVTADSISKLVESHCAAGVWRREGSWKQRKSWRCHSNAKGSIKQSYRLNGAIQ